MTIFCLFFPAFFAAYIYKKVNTAASSAEVIAHYGMSAVVSNAIVFMALVYISGAEYIIYLDTSPLTFILKFLALSTVVNILFSGIYCVI